jgi:hypothetical protein
MMWCDVIYDMIWYDIWYDDMTWHDMIWYGIPHSEYTAFVTKNNRLILHVVIVAVCSEIHTKQVNAFCGHSV